MSSDAEGKREEGPSVRPSWVVVRRLAHISGDELTMEGGMEGTGCVGTSCVIVDDDEPRSAVTPRR